MCLHDGTIASSIGIDADRHDFVVRNSNVSSLLDVYSYSYSYLFINLLGG